MGMEDTTSEKVRFCRVGQKCFFVIPSAAKIQPDRWRLLGLFVQGLRCSPLTDPLAGYARNSRLALRKNPQRNRFPPNCMVPAKFPLRIRATPALGCPRGE